MTSSHASPGAGATPASAPPAAPARLSLLRGFARLVPFARPALPRLIGGGLVALGATMLTLAVPLVIQWVIDGPITDGDRTAVLWGVAAVFALGLAEALLVFLRRALLLTPTTEVKRGPEYAGWTCRTPHARSCGAWLRASTGRRSSSRSASTRCCR
ncbi:ABC transporter ATP-binding protein [Leucobacter massiliensis]|uniref:ABC transporter ATP-binding protein n=1 Tax=Leucobacter massiliensis TaxID=1686285 RepID=UPI0011B1CF68|nr:ABC transporter ATP-binding protein [Leucobacter massiliensis]